MQNLIDLNACFKSEEEVDEATLHAARNDILAFTIYTKSDYATNWHHRRIADALNEWIFGDLYFLMIFMPPRHGKSELVSRRAPAFVHGHFPDDEIFACSYLDALAGDMCIDVQNIIDSKEYQEVFPGTKINKPGISYAKGTRNSEEHDIIGHRGKYRGQGVGGSFTGKGANWIFVDDPIKGREVADSVAFRDRLWNFYNNDLFSRLQNDLKTGRRGKLLITQTRWHEDDLSGRLIEQMKRDPKATQYKIISYPAIKVDVDDPTDPRKVGEPLWPERLSYEQIEEIRANDERAYTSLYQQNPTQKGGSLFKEHMFGYTDMPSEFDWVAITADTAYKDKEENDYTVLTAFGVVHESVYIIDVFRDRIKSLDAEKKITPFIKRFMNYGFRGAWIEPKGHGIYLNQKYSKSGIMVPSESDIKEFYSDRKFDKVERANNAIPHLANRKVFINQHIAQKEDLVAECLSFPKGKHDDFVDTVVDMIKLVYASKYGILDVI
jgi:predicted phage terminase large subunit-like protein